MTDGPPQSGTAAETPALRRPATAGGRWSEFARRHWGVGAAILVGVIVPTLIAGVSGNLQITHNDAWAYSRIAQTWGLTGRFELLGWNRSALIGQFVVLGPLARYVVAQQLFVAVLGVVFILSVYGLLVPRIGANRAGLVTIAVSVWPGFALLTTSFMADIPALSTSFLALFLADRAFARDSRTLFWLGMLVAFWSCTIRAQGIAAPVAIAIFALVTAKKRSRVRYADTIGALLVFLVAFGAFTLWRNAMPAGDHASFAIRANAIAVVGEGILRSWFDLALVAGPVALIYTRPWRWHLRSWIAAVVAGAAGVALVFVVGPEQFFLPSYLWPSGSYGGVLAPQKILFGPSSWHLIVLFALLMGMVLAGAVADRRGRPGRLLGLFTLLTVVGTIAELATVQPVYDRYLLSIAPWLVALMIPPTPAEIAADPRPRGSSRLARSAMPTIGIVSLVLTGLLSMALATNAWAFDRARWNTAEYAVNELGVPANRVDAGLEWLGWHSSAGMIPGSTPHGWGSEWAFSEQPSCVVVTPMPVNEPGWTFVRQVSYPTFMFLGESHLWIWRTHAPGC